MLCVLCSIKIVRLVELENKKIHLIELKALIDNFALEIQKTSFSSLKAKEILFVGSVDLKKSIEKISQKLNLNNVLTKLHSIYNPHDMNEIKIQASHENEIYKFVEDLFFELPGVVQFKNVKVVPIAKENLAALIQFKIFMPEECPGLISVKPSDRSFDITSIELFGKVKRHKLFCTIYNLKAYIDSSWIQIGDCIDDFKLTNVKQNSIELQSDSGRKIAIKLGAF